MQCMLKDISTTYWIRYIMQGKKISCSKYNLTFPLAIHERKTHKKGTGTASH